MTTTEYKWESGIIYGKSEKREDSIAYTLTEMQRAATPGEVGSGVESRE
jgi:hypothetical protein